MCGLVGFVGDNTVKNKDIFSFMLLVDQIRGFHSTGVATIDKGDVSIIKKAMHSTDFLDLKPVNKLINASKYSAVLGHNRAATRGKVISENAHPFEVGDITLAHNGTLTNQSLLPDSRSFEVDSENITHAINKEGIDATLLKLQGAFALTWYDYASDTVNLIRNDERTLYYCFSEDSKSLYWASESWMLSVAAGKAGVKITKPVLLPTGRLLSINMSKYNPVKDSIADHISFDNKELRKPPVISNYARKGYSYSPKRYFWVDERTYNKSTRAWVYHGVGTDGDAYKLTSTVIYNVGDCIGGTVESVVKYNGKRTYNLSAATTFKSTHDVGGVENSDTKKPLAWFNETLEDESFIDKILNKGCSWCLSPVDYENAMPISRQEYLCTDCMQEEEVKQYLL